MLTAEQIEQFHRDGFLIIRGIFSGHELELLRAAADKVEAEGVAQKGTGHIHREIDGKKVYYRSEQMWDRDPVFKAVTVKPALLEAIGQCMGHPFLPINDSFVCKVPKGNVPVEWHQDPFKETPQGTHEVPNFDTDIYLDDSTIDNGCVWGIPGHHLVGLVKLQKYTQEELFTKFGAVPMEVKAGDVVFHCISAPHGSVGNKTPTKRRIFYVHYMPQETMAHNYSGWVSKRGYTEEGKRFVESMVEERRKLNLPDVTSPLMKWSKEGFEFIGKPNTAPRYWGKLLGQMDRAEVERRKNLAPVTAQA